jgi:aquaporin Z
MRKYIAEFIGTFFLVLTVGMCVMKPDVGSFAPLAIGSVLMVMIFAGGHISGGHFNPAVTTAVWLRGKCPTADVPWYFIFQCAAGAAAAMLVPFLKGNPEVTPGDVQIVPAFVAEFIGTFALAYVVLNAATAKGTAGNSFYGLAIGFTVLSMAYAFGAVSGGAFNPAVALGVALMHLGKTSNLWLFIVAELAAGAVAAGVFRFLNPDDK